MGAGPAELQACVAEDKKQGAISLPKEAAVQIKETNKKAELSSRMHLANVP
jgi:hypothetical protein